MNHDTRVLPTPAQEQAALAWLSLLHDQPSSGDQATFSHWLQADPAHAEAYAQAQVIWELSEVPARTLADEDALALQGYLNAMNRARRSSVRRCASADRPYWPPAVSRRWYSHWRCSTSGMCMNSTPIGPV